MLRSCNRNGSKVQFFSHVSKGTNYFTMATKGENLGVDVLTSTAFSAPDPTHNEAKQDNTSIQTLKQVDEEKGAGPQVNCSCHSQNLYDTSTILSLAKATSLSSVVGIYFSKDKDVVAIKYRISTIGTLRCYVAPLVQASSFNFKSMSFD